MLATFRARVPLSLCVPIKKSPSMKTSFLWHAMRDSNPQPTDSKSATLSIELMAHVHIDILYIIKIYVARIY